ncbi:MAG: dihydroneopterin aldolase [Acaryochloris sp. CRU_2_0]|nr:dihydroneopterin aldolase [Acaryochloris sp. CRU_2_0]
MDCIHLTGINTYGYTGLLPEEQVLGQWFEVDLKLWSNLAIAGRSDRIDDTLDYRQVISLVKNLVKNARFSLLERLAAEIADQLLNYPQIEKVQVRLTKLAPPIPDFSGQITIEIMRSRSQSNP